MPINVQGRREAVERAYLLRDRIAVKVLPRDIEKAVRMSARALSFLKTHDPSELLDALGQRYVSDMGREHWEVFSSVFAPELKNIMERYENPEDQKLHALYTLGWLARLARVRGIRSVEIDRPSQNMRSSARQERDAQVTQQRNKAPADTFADRLESEARGTLQSQQSAATKPNAQPVKPEPVAVTAYRRGDKVYGRVVNKSSATGVGDIELTDGTMVTKIPGLFMCEVGESYRFTVTEVMGNGKIRGLKR